MHHSLVSMARRGRDVGTGNIAGRKCRTLTSAVSLQCRVPARLFNSTFECQKSFWIYLPGFEHGIWQGFKLKKMVPQCKAFTGALHQDKSPVPRYSPCLQMTGPLTGAPCAGSHHLCRLKNPIIVYMITCRLSSCKAGMFNVHLLIIHENGCSRMDRKKQIG